MNQENGNLKSEVHFKNGKRDGLLTGWYENGKKLVEAHFKNRKKDGLGTGWYENGKKEGETPYKNRKEVLAQFLTQVVTGQFP